MANSVYAFCTGKGNLPRPTPLSLPVANWNHTIILLYRVAQKSKPLPNNEKIVLKPVNELTGQIKV